MAKKKSKKPGSDRELQLVTQSKSFPFVEAYKSLRTNLGFIGIDRQYKTIAVTSAIPEEGKSNVSINLAVSLAETGKRVLLIDCDLRKPILHRYLKFKRTLKGLTGMLCGGAPINEAVARFTDLGIDVMPAGTIPPNPAELLGGQAMQELLARLSEDYDYIILDTPPVSVVTDAAVLGHQVDGVIFVIRQKHCTIESARLAQKNLTAAGAHIIGAVLNDFNAKGVIKGTGYNYYYEYDY